MKKNNLVMMKMFLIYVMYYYSLIKRQAFAFSACNFEIKLNQTILNKGFHRNLKYKLEIVGSDNLQFDECQVALYQMLPSGIYANDDELQDLRRNQKTYSVTTNKVNVELPAEQSSSSDVTSFGIILKNEASIWLPLHARYHSARSGGGTVNNEIDLPKMYLRCPSGHVTSCIITNSESKPNSYLCKGLTMDECQWKEVLYVNASAPVIWKVPVGNTDHYYVVSIVTIIVIIFGSIKLFQAMHKYQVDSKKLE